MVTTEPGTRRKRRRPGKGSMQILSLTEGGIRTVLHLTLEGHDRWVPSDEICRTQEIAPTFLAKITRPLLKRGILAAVRGVGGGFRLGRPPDTISMLEVIEALQGPLNFNKCLIGPGACKRDSLCPVHPVWAQIKDGTERILAMWTFSDLARQARSSRPLKKCLPEAVQKGPDARQAKHAPAKAGVHVTMRRTSCTLNDEG